MEYGYVYKITSPSNRCYVGSTINISRRWNSYFNLHTKHQIKLYRSLVKYTPYEHKFEIIWKGPIEEMLSKETELGMSLDVLTKGLNGRLPKHGEFITTVSDDTKSRIQNALKGKRRPNISAGLILAYKEKRKKPGVGKGNKNPKASAKLKGRLRPDQALSRKGKSFTPLKIVIDINTGVYYESLAEVCRLYGYTPNHFSSMLAGKKRNWTPFRIA